MFRWLIHLRPPNAALPCPPTGCQSLPGWSSTCLPELPLPAHRLPVAAAGAHRHPGAPAPRHPQRPGGAPACKDAPRVWGCDAAAWGAEGAIAGCLERSTACQSVPGLMGCDALPAWSTVLNLRWELSKVRSTTHRAQALAALAACHPPRLPTATHPHDLPHCCPPPSPPPRLPHCCPPPTLPPPPTSRPPPLLPAPTPPRCARSARPSPPSSAATRASSCPRTARCSRRTGGSNPQVGCQAALHDAPPEREKEMLTREGWAQLTPASSLRGWRPPQLLSGCCLQELAPCKSSHGPHGSGSVRRRGPDGGALCHAPVPWPLRSTSLQPLQLGSHHLQRCAGAPLPSANCRKKLGLVVIDEQHK